MTGNEPQAGDASPETAAPQLSYKELLAKAHALQAQAEELRQQEMIKVIEDIRGQCAMYGLGAEDIFGGRKSRPMTRTIPASSGYRCPSSGAMWSGKGRRPSWIKEAMSAGVDIATYKVA